MFCSPEKKELNNVMRDSLKIVKLCVKKLHDVAGGLAQILLGLKSLLQFLLLLLFYLAYMYIFSKVVLRFPPSIYLVPSILKQKIVSLYRKFNR